MIDCGLDQMSTMCYLPLTLVNSPHFNSLPNWIPNSYSSINCDSFDTVSLLLAFTYSY